MISTNKNSFPEQAPVENGGLDLLPTLPKDPSLRGVIALDVSKAGRKRLQQHPVLRANNPDLYNYTTKYAEATVGEPLNPSEYIEYLNERGLPILDIPENAVKVNTLVAKWSGKLQKHLEKEKGLTGRWLILKDGLTFAPDARELRISTLADKIMNRQRLQPNHSAEDIRKSIWDVADEVKAPAEPAPVVLKPESELTRKEKKVLAYIAELAVSHAAKYPSEEKLIETISEKSFMYPKDIRDIIGGLVAQEFLFVGGKREPFVTTNANIAHASLQPKKVAKKAKEATPAERKLDVKMANKIIDVLVKAGASEDTYTVNRLWAMLQAQNSVIVTRETPSIAEATSIKETAKALADQGILFAANLKIQTKDPSRASGREVFKIGLSQQLVEDLAEIDPANHQDHVKQLVA